MLSSDLTTIDFKNILPIISGTIIEVVAGLFFVQSNASKKHFMEFSDKLRSDQNLKESIKRAELIEDQNFKNAIYAILSLNLACVSGCDSIAKKIIDGSIKFNDDNTKSAT